MVKFYPLGKVKNVVETYVPNFETPETFNVEERRLALIALINKHTEDIRRATAKVALLLEKLEELE